MIGAGALLRSLPDPVVVYVTDGSPRDLRDATAAGFVTRDEYARARRDESLAALRLAGIGPGQTRHFQIADQEASLHLAGITRRLVELLDELRPAAMWTHPYEGGHPDHDAVAFAAHAAGRLAPDPPPLFEFTSYHARDGRMAAFEFLDAEVPAVRLSAAALELKRRMFDCFVTQRKVLAGFPVAVERYRPAPCYSFTAAPHPGPLYYEGFPWGMTGERWRALAAAALAELGVSCPL